MRRGIVFLMVLLSGVQLVTVLAADEEFGQKKRKVTKSNQEWAKLLTRNQFLVCRMKVTEPPFSGRYINNHAKGYYRCVCCDADLFQSNTKFDSGTGWPSFWQPIRPSSVDTEVDHSASEPRMEVLCMNCGSHLGHVFSDGPPPTGMRFCINSLALKFVTPAEAAKKSKAESDSKSDDSKDEAGTDAEKSAEATPKSTTK